MSLAVTDAVAPEVKIVYDKVAVLGTGYHATAVKRLKRSKNRCVRQNNQQRLSYDSASRG